MTPEEIEDKIIGAFDVGGRAFDPHELDIVVRAPHIRDGGQIARVVLPPNGSLVLNDKNAETIDEALELHHWETGTMKWDDDRIVVTVWEVGV